MHKDPSIIVNVNLREARLKKKVREHLQSLGFTKSDAGALQAPGNTKEVIRTLHSAQRAERLAANQNFIALKSSKLLKFFASGKDVIPDKISPVLERVSSGTWQGDLFRLAALTWSVPVSNGFGRRLRYLVWDESNGRLIGLIAIGDPVFNLAVRDRLIGWSTEDRSSRLVNVMDAYVLGALPPYNFLLGGKLVACLLRSRELYDDFARVYGNSVGVISQKKKRARLLAITTTSSMGRSSVYNRLKLDGIQYMEPIGYTGGWGHFHIPDSLFIELRDYLRDMDHRYADHHMFGNGPNWRLRTMKAALNALGFRDDMMKHGIQREVFISQLADNATNILQTGRGKPDLTSLLSAKDIAERAMERWIIPRSMRKTEYRSWGSDYLFDFIDNKRLSLEVETDKKNIR